MTVDLRTEVPDELWERMVQKAPAGDAMSKKELARYWIQRGIDLDDERKADLGLSVPDQDK